MQTGKLRFGDLITLEFVNTLNEAFCERHAKHCLLEDGTVHPTVQRECKKTFDLAEEIRLEYLALGSVTQNTTDSLCQDQMGECDLWAEAGECINSGGVPSTTLQKIELPGL